MNQSENGNSAYSPWQPKTLRNALLKAVFAETSTKLSIFQRAQAINATRFLPKKLEVKGHESADRSSCRRSSASCTDQKGDEAEKILNARVLDEVRFDKELSLLRKLYVEAYTELEESENHADSAGTDRPLHVRLHAAIEAQGIDKNGIDQALSELVSNQAKHSALQDQLAQQRECAEKQIKQKDAVINGLRQDMRKIRLLNNLELRLVQRWEQNRLTQASIAGSNEERSLKQKIDHLCRRIANEELIMHQVDKFAVQQFAELQGSIAEWQAKYANAMATHCAETRALERRGLELQKAHERHREIYAKRQQFVRDYLAEKEVERQLYEQQMHRVNCAIRLQAWWRGLMVRRGLGPFKKKSKRGKKGGKGKSK